MYRFISIMLLFQLTAGCGEIGTDPGGQNKATLTLLSDDGKVRDFYIGGYPTVAECLSQLEYEAESAVDRRNEFWTNQEFNYGGFEQKGWIRNMIIGAKCTV